MKQRRQYEKIVNYFLFYLKLRNKNEKILRFVFLKNFHLLNYTSDSKKLKELFLKKKKKLFFYSGIQKKIVKAMFFKLKVKERELQI